MKQALYNEITDALKNRNEWAERQATAYRMRNGGIRRKSKPWPNAPDGWYPLGDTMIEKNKPGYSQQLYGSETIASFVCLKQQDQELTGAASYWFDYQLKQRSNFERTMFVAIDQMLEQAFTPIKVYWDASCKRLAFDQVDPLHLIVPQSTQEYNQNGGTDWMVHVLHLSEAEYRANDKFVQDDEFIKRIKGKGQSDSGQSDSGNSDKKQSVDLKEGINCSANDNEIVLWEVYKRNRRNKTIKIETISPLIPCDEDENVVRPEFGLPYNKGMFKSGECFPFFKIRTEIKGKGHYSSRGIIEINAPFERSLTATWNTIHTHHQFSAQPNYENTLDAPIPNPNNVKTGPGKILPRGLRLAQHPPPPATLREDMEMTRAIAEERNQIPNYAASEHLTGMVPKSQTATGQNLIAAQSAQGIDLKARVFRLDLAEGLNMAWAIALQYLVPATDATGQVNQTSLQYIVDNEIRNITPDAIHEEYEIQPNGSADSWNKGAVVAKRIAFYQQFQTNPYIALDELTKWVLEGDDPRNVKRLYRDPGITAKKQDEDQAMECLLMQSGYGPEVLPADDDKAHLQNLAHFAQDKISRGQMTPELARLVLDHGMKHQQQLVQKKDPMAKQIAQQLAPLAQLLGQIAQADQPQNIVQMQAQGAQNDVPVSPGPSATGSPKPATPSQSDHVADATKVGNMLVNMAKAGVPVSPADFNKVLIGLNLPPITMQKQSIPQPQPEQQLAAAVT